MSALERRPHVWLRPWGSPPVNSFFQSTILIVIHWAYAERDTGSTARVGRTEILEAARRHCSGATGKLGLEGFIKNSKQPATQLIVASGNGLIILNHLLLVYADV